MMYGYFAGNIYAAFFSLADDIDSTLGGNVADVYMCAGVFSDDAVTCNSDILLIAGTPGTPIRAETAPSCM